MPSIRYDSRVLVNGKIALRRFIFERGGEFGDRVFAATD